MEKQIEDQFKKAFFDILNEDGPESYDYLRKLLNEIIDKLCRFVPNRTDIHQKIRDDLEGQIGWDIQNKLIIWIEKFQAPIHDTTTKKWLEEENKPVGDFLKMYYEHLEITYKETQDAREAIARGENIFNPVTGEMPKNMKTGR
tara:strand:+ start:10 stop:441 length:432 start_codon:yes stop_codon:yes gene_type:complete